MNDIELHSVDNISRDGSDRDNNGYESDNKGIQKCGVNLRILFPMKYHVVSNGMTVMESIVVVA